MGTLRSAAGRLPGPLLCALALLSLEGSVVYQAYAVDVEVKDEANDTCLFGKWMMDLTVTYESEHGGYKNTVLTIPEHVRYDGSSCDNETSGPVLAIEFGEGNSWRISFLKTESTYQGLITFTYNTNDTAMFPEAKMKGLITTSTNYPLHPVDLDTVFVCQNVDSVVSDNVTQKFWNVTLQAFLQFGTLSNRRTECNKDAVVVPETAAPNNTSITNTSIPKTDIGSTTVGNASRHLTIKLDEIPATGTYSVKNGTEICLLATMGLQLNVSKTLVNVNPNTTTASGSCSHTSAVLSLRDTDYMVEFLFAIKNVSFERFFLKEVNISVSDPENGTEFAGSDDLSFWEASLGSSYMCRKKENLVVTPSCSLNVFNLRIQPFGVKDGQFSIAQECLLDDDTYLIPVIVGAGLVGLILMIVIAYALGRRQSQPGYQTL